MNEADGSQTDAYDPFFIVGVGRSGTTLLRLMLHSHPRLAIPYETHFLTQYVDEHTDVEEHLPDAALRSLIERMLAEPMLAQWDESFSVDEVVAAARGNDLRAAVDAVYRCYANAKGKARWGDKSDYLDRMHLINRLFPTARFIHIVRDGRDVAASVMRMTWGPTDLIAAAHWWDEHVRLGRRMGAILGPSRYTEVRFEDLVAAPQETLTRLCEFLGEAYEPAMLDYHRESAAAIPEERKHQHYNNDTPPDANRTYAWKKSLSATQAELFQRYARRSLAELDYELVPPQTSPVRLKLAQLGIFASRMLSRG